jgi:hypothetical protein
MNFFQILWRALAILSPMLLFGTQLAQAGLVLSSSEVKLTQGGKTTLVVSNAEGKVKVSSSNKKVVKAEYDHGQIKLEAKKSGSATIIVRDKKNSISAAVTVESIVTAPLAVSPTSVTLAPGAKTSLTVSNASGTLRVSSANTKVVVAEISNGKVMLEAKAAGTTTLKVSDSKTSVTVPVTVTSSGGGGTPTASGTFTLLAWNDLGMHCMDGDYSVFSILPPYNNLHAQLVNSSTNKLVTSGVTLSYEAMADADGSINSFSSSKTNFWQYAKAFFGVDLVPDVGLAGNPTASATPAPMTFEAASGQFKAEGIPITPYDDSHRKNFYPMVKVVAKDSTGKQLAQARVVLPVSDEMSCAACHASGSGNAAKPTAGWVIGEANQEREYKKNILRLHDEKQAGKTAYINALASKGFLASGLLATAESGKPILCASCHASNALPGTGIAGIKPLTEAIHSNHAMVKDATTGQLLESVTNRSACYQCHPGSETKCLRGVMGNAVLTDGKAAMDCQSCHGPMSNVGRAGRVGWLDQPNCQSCHHDGKRELTAVTSSGILKKWLDTRYATNPNVPGTGFSLYRFSKGHGNLQCEACHGATHAEYPSSHKNDNVLSQDVQGREGTIGECSACHKTVPMTANKGPHGMHTVGNAWVDKHGDYAENSATACAYCHGADYRGGILSTVKKARTFAAEGKTVSYTAGQKVGCYDCHNGPKGD